MDLLQKAEENIQRFALIPAGTRVLIAVSGGVDSMVLLDVLQRLAGKHTWSLHVAHFNHQLRADASDADEQFVQTATQRLQLTFHSGRGDVAALARERGISVEMAGREARHRFLAETTAKHGVRIVALAHHADDQVETFWLRILRGDVGTGIAGMRWKRKSAENPEIELVRPLLDIPKEEIVQFARNAGLPFREDRSNRDLRYQRNRLRHDIMPALEKFQPRLKTITLRAAEALLAEKDFIANSAVHWLRTKQPEFDQLHPALQREIIHAQLIEKKITLSFELIELLRVFAGRALSVSPIRAIVRDSAGVVQEAERARAEFSSAEKRLILLERGEDRFEQTDFSWQMAPQRGAGEPGVEYFDAETVGREVLLRHWRPGDRFQPIGAGGSSKLQDIFTNLKVPHDDRRKRILAVADNEQIFWVEGLRIGEEFKVTPVTKRILRWHWSRMPAKSA